MSKGAIRHQIMFIVVASGFCSSSRVLHSAARTPTKRHGSSGSNPALASPTDSISSKIQGSPMTQYNAEYRPESNVPPSPTSFYHYLLENMYFFLL